MRILKDDYFKSLLAEWEVTVKEKADKAQMEKDALERKKRESRAEMATTMSYEGQE